MRWLKDVEWVGGYPGFADRLDIEDGKEFAEQLVGVEGPERIQAALGDGAVDVVIVPDVPDPTVGEDARPALVGMFVQGKAVLLVLQFAEQVSLELLEGGFVVVAWLGAVRIGGEAVGLGFDDDSPAREIEVRVSARRLVGNAVVYLEGVKKSADVLANIVFVS